MKFVIVQRGPKSYEVKVGKWHGVFASAERAAQWASERVAGVAYVPIPQAGSI